MITIIIIILTAGEAIFGGIKVVRDLLKIVDMITFGYLSTLLFNNLYIYIFQITDLKRSFQSNFYQYTTHSTHWKRVDSSVEFGPSLRLGA